MSDGDPRWCDPAQRPLNEHGTKPVHKSSKSAYSEWRHDVGHYCYVNDVDFIEVDFVEWQGTFNADRSFGPPRLVAVVDTTEFPMSGANERYRANAIGRFAGRDRQGAMLKQVASQLGIPLYFVMYRPDCREFWVCRIHDRQWRHFDEQAYIKWLRSLRRR